MTALAEKIYGEALDLPIEDRLGLLDKLLESITPMSKTIQDAWIRESEQRYAAYKAGDVEAIPGEEVLSRIQERLRK